MKTTFKLQKTPKVYKSDFLKSDLLSNFTVYIDI